MALMTEARATVVRVPILMYHSIAEQASGAFRPFAVPPRVFAAQMAHVRTLGYTPVTVGQLAAALADRRHRLPERPVVLTFDDGFADFYSEALPVIAQHNFAATLYITTGYLGQTSRWLTREGEGDRPMLTPGQVREVAQSGIECGAHTHSHPPLDIVDGAVARREIETSKAILEQHIGKAVSTFAYPHGYHTRRVQHLVAEAGFASACAVRYACSSTADDCYALPRLRVGPATDRPTLKRLLEGRVDGGVLALRIRSATWRRLRRSALSRVVVGSRNQEMVPYV